MSIENPDAAKKKAEQESDGPVMSYDMKKKAKKRAKPGEEAAPTASPEDKQ